MKRPVKKRFYKNGGKRFNKTFSVHLIEIGLSYRFGIKLE